MNHPAMIVDKLSKAYRIGLKEDVPDSLIGAMRGMVMAPFRNWRRLKRLNTFRHQEDSDDIFWALRNVSFNLQEGEVLGVIGRNGAGKSTLLKILSRITEPTSGRATIRGRVSSLLEVGTGFHPELSGRENIYLNGTILGMTKREINRKFDEIVAFSGVEKFIDTPVKRYSSGMRVRLAFAVAAHLEPEILIIDEVLAVGDAEFQAKCLGKMRDVAQGGRTIVFVSHNMAAVRSLCERSLILANGKIIDEGDTTSVVDHYLANGFVKASNGIIGPNTPRQGTGEARFNRIQITDPAGQPTSELLFTQPLQVTIECEVHEAIRDAHFGVAISALDSTELSWSHTMDGGKQPTYLCPGVYSVVATFDIVLLPRDYTLSVSIFRNSGGVVDFVDRIVNFSVIKTGVDPKDNYRWQRIYGYVRAPSIWTINLSPRGKSAPDCKLIDIA
jgi:lipopolysaccharide transport system ATP-binding protein